MKLLIQIDRAQSGMRLDQVVSQSCETCSRSRAAALITDGTILVDGRAKRPGYRVKPHERVAGSIPETESLTVHPSAMALDILYEDDYLLVVNKPPGLVVHPAPGHEQDTLVSGLLAHSPVFGDPCWDPVRPGIVHRLDRETSGLILIAKTIKSLEFLQKEFKQRRVEKFYLALVQGKDIPDQGEIELPIGRHPKQRKRMAVCPETGKYARTGFQVKERLGDDTALMEIRLYTGRTHQIRVHFYDQGMPLLGDSMYQQRKRRKNKTLASRQMLHSWRLGFRHPYSGKKMEVEAPVPDDFSAVIRSFSEK